METQNIVKILIEQLNGGSAQAFDELYKLFSPRVFSFALSLSRNQTEAEDTVQEIFLKIWDKRHELSPSGSFESFLFTMSKNTILNNIRKTNYHHLFLEYKKHSTKPVSALDQELNYNELENLYKKAINKLSPRKKEIFILNQTHSLSYPEIAEKLGISTKTVRNQINAASTEIQHFISSLGFNGMLILFIFIK
ncbi:RNA polymerase sigma factor [Maribellus maritimus]|uniref:RNA polymerase sigma factor n=1 Tax=Maribellus maritimus TaxID=2870838 RepID=UPI001EEB0DB0|nr:RNA polymerase sigma-70 factor [Maribellus maritimus]MCG6191007.1 RNA polymerase sigma-70 factor [Maribellus maritimus]